MDAFKIEEQKTEILKFLSREISPCETFEQLNYLFTIIKDSDDDIIIDSYKDELCRFLYEKISSVEAYGIDPFSIKHNILSVKNLIEIFAKSEFYALAKSEIERMMTEVDNVENALSGNNTLVNLGELSFPAIIKSSSGENFGQIETFEINIKSDSALSEDQFHVVPSGESIEPRLKGQIRTSWNIALSYLKKYFKNPSPFHKVIIIFHHKFAGIEGFSLGIALTLGFIKELFKEYNTPLYLDLSGKTAFTGGIDSQKRIRSVGSSAVCQKTEIVFYSLYNTFVVPDPDFQLARSALNELKLKHPSRDLKIINAEDFEDLINDRRILDIRKAGMTERALKYAKSNKTLIALSFAILIVSLLIIFANIDKNPYGFQIVENNVHVVNRYGNILWTLKQPFVNTLNADTDIPFVQRIFDIDDDGTNEVIVAYERDTGDDANNYGRIACFGSGGDLLWQYKFRDQIQLGNIKFDKRQYMSRILDIVNEGGRNILLATSRNLMYPSAIFKLDVRTGERIPGTLWSQGHFQMGEVGDYDNDGKYEVLIGGINNKSECAFFLMIDLEKLNGQTPNTKSEYFDHIPLADLKKYLLFSKTDISELQGKRLNNAFISNYEQHAEEILVNVSEGFIGQPMGLVYRFNTEMTSVKFQHGDDFPYIRDSLVRTGELEGPLTYTDDYSRILFEGIREWNGKEFVPFSGKMF